MWFLERVLDVLFPPRSDQSIVRATSYADLAALTTPRLTVGCTPSATALLSFTHPTVRALIHEAKYHHNTAAWSLLGAVLRAHLDTLPHACVRIVPIPLSTERYAARGYNQTAMIARAAVAHGSMTDVLVRTRDTASQTTLTRHERLQNMHGAFHATDTLDPTYTYIVLDDVLTTGATLQAAIEALTEAGATALYPLVLAH